LGRQEVREMAPSAYLLIRASAAARRNGYLAALEDLWALPEVEYVEPVSGLYDCVARVEAPITRLTSLVREVMEKKWVERVELLRLDQAIERASDWEEARTARLRRRRASVWAYRRGLQHRPTSGQHPYAGHAAAIRAELEESRSLSRQLEIVMAQYQTGRTAAVTAGHR
jgi:hypothetical protein